MNHLRSIVYELRTEIESGSYIEAYEIFKIFYNNIDEEEGGREA